MSSKHESFSNTPNLIAQTSTVSNPSSTTDTGFRLTDRATSTDSGGDTLNNILSNGKHTNNIDKSDMLNEKRRCLSSSSCLINSISSNNSAIISRKSSFSHKKIVNF